MALHRACDAQLDDVWKNVLDGINPSKKADE